MQRELPPVGADIVTREGRARVLGQEILAGQVLVETEDHRRMLIDASEVFSVIKAPPRDAQEQALAAAASGVVAARDKKQDNPPGENPSQN